MFSPHGMSPRVCVCVTSSSFLCLFSSSASRGEIFLRASSSCFLCLISWSLFLDSRTLCSSGFISTLIPPLHKYTHTHCRLVVCGPWGPIASVVFYRSACIQLDHVTAVLLCCMVGVCISEPSTSMTLQRISKWVFPLTRVCVNIMRVIIYYVSVL